MYQLTSADYNRIKSDESAFACGMSLEEARDLIDNLPHLFDEFTTAMDEAQGAVHSKSTDVAYVVIRITR
jgi:ribosomal protein L7/L12